MDAMADFRVGIGKFKLGFQAFVNRLPGLAAVLGAKRARRRDCDENPVRIVLVQKNGVHGHAAGAGLPEISFGGAQAGKFVPRLATIRGFENRRVFGTGVYRIRIGQRRFNVPDAFEFPRMLRAVIPHVGADGSFVNEFITFAFGKTFRAFQIFRIAAGRGPGFAAVIGALDDLPEPTAALRSVNAIGIHG